MIFYGSAEENGMTKWVYTFGDGAAEGSAKDRNLLGGKGANLAEMCSLGLPVPPGFTITTDACNWYYANGKAYPSELEAQVDKALDHIAKIAGRRFGDPESLLLVSVRSGARASMPGMMDTVLNLGLNDETVEALAAIPATRVSPMTAIAASSRCIPTSCWASTTRCSRKSSRTKRPSAASSSTPSSPPPSGRRHRCSTRRRSRRNSASRSRRIPKEQLWGAIGAVFSSWMNHRAITYRRLHDIPESWGTAVNVQAMVFGNMGDSSATGVAFTRNPSTGEKKLYGEFLVNAQGEDVVAGIRTPQNITEAARIAAGSDKPSLQKLMPEAFQAFVDISTKLEKHYRDMQDLEFTIERGKLWMLQTRSGKRTAKAALKIAVEMAAEGLITRAGSRAAHRPGLARPAAASDHRSEGGQAQRHRRRPAGVAGRGDRRDRVLFRRGRRDEGGRAARSSSSASRPARRTFTACMRRRHPDHARRHDQPRGRGGARHGQALRFGRGLAARRLSSRHADGAWARPSRRATSSPSTAVQRPGAQGRRADAPAGAVGRFRQDHGMGRRDPSHEGAHQCRDAG
jgi:hypothetical protein